MHKALFFIVMNCFYSVSNTYAVKLQIINEFDDFTAENKLTIMHQAPQDEEWTRPDGTVPYDSVITYDLPSDTQKIRVLRNVFPKHKGGYVGSQALFDEPNLLPQITMISIKIEGKNTESPLISVATCDTFGKKIESSTGGPFKIRKEENEEDPIT